MNQDVFPMSTPVAGTVIPWAATPYIPRASRVDNAARDSVPDTDTAAAPSC